MLTPEPFRDGTAVLYNRCHLDETVAPTRETMTDIKAVLAEANRLPSLPRFGLSRAYCRAFARYPADQGHCAGGALRAVYPQTDVCCQDRLLEIEAAAAHPLAFMSGQRD